MNGFGELDQIYLRRKLKLRLTPGDGDLPLAFVATALRNLERLGFACEQALIERLRTLTEKDFVRLYTPLERALRALTGADKAFDPMYPNFPQQVMEASDAELWINAMMHYLGDWIGARIMPVYTKEDRPPLLERVDLRVIQLGDDDELWGMGRDLIAANTSISETDKADVRTMLKHAADDITRILPTAIPNKENLATVTAALLENGTASDILLTKYFGTATDVLRLAVALSEGDVSLAKSTKFKSFRRPERKLLLALANRIERPLEDMQRYAERWKRLGERLHPGEYRKTFPRIAEAFDAIRAGKRQPTFAGKVEKALRTSDMERLLDLLGKRPGEFARRLDHTLRSSHAPMEVIERFAAVADQVSTPVLLQAMVHFAHRHEDIPIRAFFPKGSAAKVISIPNRLPKMAHAVSWEAREACAAALKRRFAELEPLGKVYVDDRLESFLVPFSQRSASKALRTLVRGSRVPLPETGDTARLFLWWKEGEVAGKKTGRVDIDLSACMYDADWNYKEHISYTNLRSSKYQAAHSGDITSAPNGACEFIDLHLPSITKYGGRYVVMMALSFTRQPFSAMPEAFVGWMMRKKPKSGEVFEPSTVVDRIDLSADQRICIPAIIDLVDRTLIWTDVGLRGRPKWQINLESNQSGIQHLGRAMTTLRKPTLQDLFGLHADARGERVDSAEEAETVFAPDTGITPFDIERIMAEFLA